MGRQDVGRLLVTLCTLKEMGSLIKANTCINFECTNKELLDYTFRLYFISSSFKIAIDMMGRERQASLKGGLTLYLVECLLSTSSVLGATLGEEGVGRIKNKQVAMKLA